MDIHEIWGSPNSSRTNAPSLYARRLYLVPMLTRASGGRHAIPFCGLTICLLATDHHDVKDANLDMFVFEPSPSGTTER